ncbi:hypothetical protein CC1G_03202 [Coprinopsis cinerea okayama7|uniref:Uncharacterized protein n=1 Tax=Coprinopsis cinerea (strain Okayama-7 / 130 / ATCC MYA-4618 / FGSC 9003) TaxID=240176 RepID=A8N759_COPC7|nr:hypothetical protein CC1G_03202 [Coprinopsis cinerea okayama7\|eukprot:XP_001830665.2 hypothetical protein CC1G_03202 [Coprinopsis cinerea okayama7\
MSSSASAQAARHEAAMKAKRQQLKEQERARIDAGLPIIVHRAAMSSASEHAAKHEAEQVEKKRREGRGNRIGTADATTTPKNRTRNKRPATDAPPEPLPIVSELVEYYVSSPIPILQNPRSNEVEFAYCPEMRSMRVGPSAN